MILQVNVHPEVCYLGEVVKVQVGFVAEEGDVPSQVDHLDVIVKCASGRIIPMSSKPLHLPPIPNETVEFEVIPRMAGDVGIQVDLKVQNDSVEWMDRRILVHPPQTA